MENLLKDTTNLIQRDFELENHSDFLTEEQLLDALTEHVAYMMKYRMETLMSTLYRMDVSEKKVASVLSPLHPEPADKALARLIIERQKNRVHTKQTYKTNPKQDWFDF